MHVFNECVVFKKPSVVFHLRYPVFSFPNCHEFAIWVRDSARCPRLDQGHLKKWTECGRLDVDQQSTFNKPGRRGCGVTRMLPGDLEGRIVFGPI